MEEIRYNNIFVVLVYKNYNDLETFFIENKSLLKENKVVVVSAFYNESTDEIIKKICKKNNADFIPVENKGYSFGNNIGIEFSKKNYIYNNIIVCNSDVLIEKFDEKSINSYSINAPKIVTKNKKNQNPYWAVKNSLCEKLIYISYKKNNTIMFYFAIIINKIIRELFLIFNKNKVKECYAAHGAFLIFPSSVLDQLLPVFDENIFLFSEEAVLAKKASKLNIPIMYNPKIKIKHYEDGTMKVSNINERAIEKESYIYYYEHYEK